MSFLEERFNAARDDLQNELAGVNPPPFKPNRPVVPAAMLALALVFGVGVVGYLARSSDQLNDTTVTTQPEVPSVEAEEVPLNPESTEVPAIAGDPEPAVIDEPNPATSGPETGAAIIDEPDADTDTDPVSESAFVIRPALDDDAVTNELVDDGSTNEDEGEDDAGAEQGFTINDAVTSGPPIAPPATATPTPPATTTPDENGSNTVAPTATSTPTADATVTPGPTATSSASAPVATATPTVTSGPRATPRPTSTPRPVASSTPTPTATPAPPTSTPLPATATPTSAPAPTGPISAATALSNPASGEYVMPANPSAWSPDGTKVIVYNRVSGAHHLAIDTRNLNADPVELPWPADIEQIHWNPLIADQVIYTEDQNLMIFDLTTQSSSVAHRFENCDSVDSGFRPVPPSANGTVSLLCHSADDVTQVTYNLASGVERRSPTDADTAAVPSPSGNAFAQWNADGTVSVLDSSLNDTGITVDLDDNSFNFVSDGSGQEWLAAALYNGSAVGSLVLSAIDGSGTQIVVIGPRAGDPYPPSGTRMSAAGSKVVVAMPGTDDGLAGRITMVDLAGSLTDPQRRSLPHESQGLHGHWSKPFVAVTPSGLVAWSSDNGTDIITTRAMNFIEQVSPTG